MRDVENTLRENEEFLRGQARTIAARLALLPRGRIKAKPKGSEPDYYLQYRTSRAAKTDYIGKGVPASLCDHLDERSRIEKERQRGHAPLRRLKMKEEGPTDLIDPLMAILRKLTEDRGPRYPYSSAVQGKGRRPFGMFAASGFHAAFQPGWVDVFRREPDESEVPGR